MPDDESGADLYLRAIEYFTNSVPPRALLTMHLEGLDELISREHKWAPVMPVEAHVGIIALVAYFEAFCKDLFAAIVNVCPRLLTTFKHAGQSTQIDSVELLDHIESPLSRVGFLLAEQIDFGTARKVNAVYRALLSVSPFSKREIGLHDRLLRDRNLIVHHGGILTSKYLGAANPGQLRPHHQSLDVTRRDFDRARHFLARIADKMSSSARERVAAFIENNNLTCDDVAWQAVALLAWDYSYGNSEEVARGVYRCRAGEL
jgi:hypothetical protein